MHVEASDIAERTSVRRLGLCAQLGVQRSFFHAAGVLSDAVLGRQTPAALRHVFGPKVIGLSLLQLRLASYDLRAWILFSSAAALIGGTGQANYSAANCGEPGACSGQDNYTVVTVVTTVW